MKGFLTTMEPVILQSYHGDITIVPPISFTNYIYLFIKPDHSFIQRCVKSGERFTWTSILILVFYYLFLN
jgi:hypothetical protein